MRFPWEAVTAIAAACGLVSGFAVFVISAVVDRRLGAFLEKLDMVFVRKELADERHTDHLQRLQALERGAGR